MAFVHRLIEQETPSPVRYELIRTNPKDLQNRFQSAGVHVPENCFYTSAMATAAFLTPSGRPKGLCGGRRGSHP